MSIFYTVIARVDTPDPESGLNIHILAEVDESSGNYPQITREIILKNLPKSDRAAFNYQEKYVFHILCDQGYVYVSLTEQQYSKQRAQVFLNEVKDSFCSKFTTDIRGRAISFSLNDRFSNVISEKMKYYNENTLDPKMARIRGDAQATLGIMEQNVESLMERGEKLDMLVKKTTTLKNDSSTLAGRSKALKEKTRSEAMKRNLIIGTGIVVIGAFFFL